MTPSREKNLRFTNSYHEVVEQVIYRSGTPRPKTLMDLNSGILEVSKDSNHVDSLQTLKKTVAPQLTWLTNEELDSNSLISLLDQGLIDYTIADSTQALLIQRFYPKLQIAFDISTARQIAWALPKSEDNSLYDAINSFFKQIKQDKTLEQLLERYYGHVGSLDYVDKCKFYHHQQIRLPLYKSYFLNAAKQHGLDWRLLAAVGYQESHWQDSAISPTGVRGIMMLTNDTALQVGIKDRTDPIQSISGGAIYFQQQLKKIPQQIAEPDRTWFALAAYNVGYGHLEDARILTKQQGRNPDKWLDVKQTLPLLSDEYWFMQTKHGYARGDEPVIYVENVRNYYDLLVWLNTEKPQSPLHKKPLFSVKQQIKKALEKVSDFFRQTQKSLGVQAENLGLVTG
jgi:membrane-bound lytic murein transglycosylase F